MAVELTQEEADKLRDAIRAERKAADDLELATLEFRTRLHHARTFRAALLDTIADTYGFDSTTAHEFDWATRTLTKKG